MTQPGAPEQPKSEFPPLPLTQDSPPQEAFDYLKALVTQENVAEFLQAHPDTKEKPETVLNFLNGSYQAKFLTKWTSEANRDLWGERLPLLIFYETVVHTLDILATEADLAVLSATPKQIMSLHRDKDNLKAKTVLLKPFLSGLVKQTYGDPKQTNEDYQFVFGH